MTDLLEQREVWILRGAGTESGTPFSDESVRRLLLAGIDRVYASSLPRLDNDADQLESDLGQLRRLPYLVTGQGEIEVPLASYLGALVERLRPRAEADDVAVIRDAVSTRAKETAAALDELLSALAEAVPPSDFARVLTLAGVVLQGLDLDRAPRSAWALALHLAARDDRLDALVQAVAGPSPPARLAAALAARPVWGPAVRDASEAHLKLEGRSASGAIAWDQVVAAATASTKAVLADLATSFEGHPAVYRPRTFVPRQALDEQFALFRKAEAKALIVAGEAGSGKTSLIVHWANQLLDGGDAVVLLTGATLGDADPWEAVRRALGVGADQWPDAVGAAASDAGHSVFVLVDGVNEVPGPSGPIDLFDRVNLGLDGVPRQCRVVLTFTMPSWRRTVRQRGAAIRAANYYLPSGGAELALTVAELDDTELERAWALYREEHSIPTPFGDLPAELRRLLRNPSMLQLTAETFAGKPVAYRNVEGVIGLFNAYYERKTYQGSTVDREFLRLLSLAIFDKRQMPIPYAVLSGVDSLHDLLGVEAGSPYARMLERAVLRQVEIGRYRPPDSVEYTITRFGAFVLAGALCIKNGSTIGAVQEAARHLSDFPVLADTVRLLLRWSDTDAISADDYVELAGHEHPDIREMVAQALAEISASDPTLVRDVVHRLLTSPRAGGRERERAGLRAAYLVTSAESAVDLSGEFVDIAKNADEALRRDALDTLYLTSGSDAEFVYGVMNRIADQVEIVKPRQARRLIEFLAGLSITLYTSRPGWERGKPTSDLWYKVGVERLQLSKAAAPVLTPVRALVFAIGSRQFSQRIFDGFLVNDKKSMERVFQLSDEAKAPFRRAISLLDPAAPIDDDATRTLEALLSSDLDIFNLLAAQVVAIHAVVHLGATAPVVDELWGRLGRTGRLWLLTAFAALLETTPVEWVDLLEDLTRRTVAAHAEVALGLDLGYLGETELDQLLFPLGLAYGKRATQMPVFTELVVAGLESGGANASVNDQAVRCIRALGRVGFHHPQTVLIELGSLWPRIGEAADTGAGVRAEMITALATVRILHLAEVDDFLMDMEASPEFTAAVRAGIDTDPIYDEVRLLGLYNNAVHQAVCFPKMRDGLLAPIYRLLVDSHDAKGAVGKLTRLAWDMLVDADFRLENWAEPPSASGPCR
ncbi:MAG: hypothetical protein QOI99_1165 [Actinomycetota bacterium]|nr:hypothetical protein [Actinomycetota bacterium]